MSLATRMLIITGLVIIGVGMFASHQHSKYCSTLKHRQYEKRNAYLSSQSKECEDAKINPLVCMQYLMLLQNRLNRFDEEVLKHERCL